MIILMTGVGGGEFKAGVAYMEVPRCDQCGMWSNPVPRADDARWCRALNIHTGASFGCVRWVERAAVPVPVLHNRREGDQ